MPTELEIALKSLETSKAEVETLKKQLVENDTKAIKAKADNLEVELSKKTEELTLLKAKNEELTTSLNTVKATLDTTTAELTKIQGEQKFAERVQKLVTALEATVEKAQDMVTKTSSLDDEAFSAYATYMAEKLAEYKSASPTVVHQEVPPSTTVQKPALKPIPKATSAPAPAAGPAKKISTGPGGGAPPISPANPLPPNSKVDFNGATAADATQALENAVVIEEPALAVAVDVTEGAEKVRASIASHMHQFLGKK